MKQILLAGTIGLIAGSSYVAPAIADDEAIYASCKKELKFSDSACDCVLEEVKTELNDTQREVFVEIIKDNRAAMTEAISSGKLTGEDMLSLTNFMTKTPAKCENK